MDGKAKLLDSIGSVLRRMLFQVLAFGPMPRHISFIPDGNRRYGRKRNLQEGKAHRIDIARLTSILKYCYEMGVPCVSIYGFSIDNFKRKPVEVQMLMDLIRESAKTLMHDTSSLNELGVRVKFLGNLDMLDESIREMVNKIMIKTSTNDRFELLVCLAYSSSNEIVHGVEGSYEEKRAPVRQGKDEVDCRVVSSDDLEKHMYFSGYPDPDILIRTSGETRLSNYLLWQSLSSLLSAPRCLWPEISLRHLVWAVLEYQRNYGYLEKIKKKL